MAWLHATVSMTSLSNGTLESITPLIITKQKTLSAIMAKAELAQHSNPGLVAAQAAC
jgi:hypothetical protein